MILIFPIFAFIVHIITIILGFGKFLNQKFSMIFFTIVSVFSALFIIRLHLPDYGIYLNIYNSLNPDLKLSEQVLYWAGEPLYLSINHYFKKITNDFSYLHFLLVFIPLVIKSAFLVRWGAYATISFIFYMSFLFYADAYLLRSTMASGIVLLAIWELFKEKKSYRFFILVIIASGIHVSALISLPIWYFRKYSISQMSGYFLLLLILVLGLIGVGHALGTVLTTFFSTEWYIISMVTEYSQSKYGQSIGILRISVIFYFLITFVFIAYKNVINQMFPQYDFVLAIMLYNLFILIGFSDFEVMADRLFRINAFIFALAFGQICKAFKNEERLLISSILIIFFNIIPYITQPVDVGFLK